MDIQKLFEELYVKNAPSWSIERDLDGSYKYHATKSAFVLFENQQLEIESLKSELAEAQAESKWISVNDQMPEGFVLVEKAKLMQIVGSAAIIEPITRGNPLMTKYKTELNFILSTVRAMIEAQEPAND